MNRNNISMSIALITLLSGCGSSSDTQTDIDSELSVHIKSNQLTGDPSSGKTVPSISDAKAQLGMKLFFTKGLGGDKDSACVSCHHPVLGGGDKLSLPIGVSAIEPDLLGRGRIHTSSAVNYENGWATVPRNARSTFNVALWNRSLFWDGRVEKIEGGMSTPDSGFSKVDSNAGANLAVAQAQFPVTSAEEMRGFVFEQGNSTTQIRDHLASRLSDSTLVDYIPNSWQSEFTSIYGDNSLTFANIVDAIGAYENSQLFINTPWKAYVDGNQTAISTEAKNGAKLFFSSYEAGGVNCVECHSGDFFTDEKFHVMAIPQVGRGKGDDTVGDDDFGRSRVDSIGKYAFRTPTLLNVEVTGPWGHSGAYTTLDGIVSHMVDIDSAVAGYDVSLLDSNVKTTNVTANTARALAQLKTNRTNEISPHQNVSLSASQVSDLVAFLKTLTDPCTKDRTCLDKWIPDTSSSGPDSLQLNAVDSSGSLL